MQCLENEENHWSLCKPTSVATCTIFEQQVDVNELDNLNIGRLSFCQMFDEIFRSSFFFHCSRFFETYGGLHDGNKATKMLDLIT